MKNYMYNLNLFLIRTNWYKVNKTHCPLQQNIHCSINVIVHEKYYMSLTHNGLLYNVLYYLYACMYAVYMYNKEKLYVIFLKFREIRILLLIFTCLVISI